MLIIILINNLFNNDWTCLLYSLQTKIKQLAGHNNMARQLYFWLHGIRTLAAPFDADQRPASLIIIVVIHCCKMIHCCIVTCQTSPSAYEACVTWLAAWKVCDRDARKKNRSARVGANMWSWSRRLYFITLLYYNLNICLLSLFCYNNIERKKNHVKATAKDTQTVTEQALDVETQSRIRAPKERLNVFNGRLTISRHDCETISNSYKLTELFFFQIKFGVSCCWNVN